MQTEAGAAKQATEGKKKGGFDLRGMYKGFQKAKEIAKKVEKFQKLKVIGDTIKKSAENKTATQHIVDSI